VEIGHLHILVNDVDASNKFYQQNFAFEQVAAADFGVILRDDTGIDFVIGPAENGEVQGDRMHFGLRQANQSKVKEKFDEMSSKGHEFVTSYVENEFITLFSINDPDGNLIEIYYAEEFQDQQ